MAYYVRRDEGGAICGLFANPQPQSDGSSLTLPDPLPDDHAEVVLYLSKQENGNGVSESVSNDAALVQATAAVVRPLVVMA